MKALFTLCIGFFVLFILFLSGCDLVSQGDSPPKASAGNDLVINEVFTISPEKYYAFSWFEILNPTSKTIPLQSVTNPASAFSVGANGTIIKTDDDGNTWSSITTNPPSTANYNSASFPLPDTGYLVGDAGTVVKLRRDPTGTFTLTNLNPPVASTVNLRDVYAAPSPGRLVIVIGDNGTIIQSVDRGFSWGIGPIVGIPQKNLRGLTYLGQNDIYAVGDGGAILKGKVNRQWVPQSPPFIQATTNYYSIGFFALNGRGYIVGENGNIATTSNGGTIWKPVEIDPPVTSTLRSIFISPSGILEFVGSRAWIVGDNGTILRTNDSVWIRQVSGTTASLYHIEFVDSVRGWALGEGGLVLATTNGGESWAPQPTNTSNKLTDISILQLQFDLINFYALELYAIKNHVFFDVATQRLNEDVIVGVDTGLVQLNTQAQITFRNGQITIDALDPIPPGGFFVINNDSAKFKDHTNLGPGRVQSQNIGLSTDSIRADQNPQSPTFGIIFQWDAYKWKLPASGEVRLYKVFVKLTRGGFPTFIDGSVKCVDVVRWGGFKATHGEFNVPGLGDNNSYIQNEPAGFIPEFSSLSRYYNMVGVDVTASSTAPSFYFTDPSQGENPLPGWASQRGK